MSNEQIIFLLRMAAKEWCRKMPDSPNRPYVLKALKLTEDDRLPDVAPVFIDAPKAGQKIP